MIFPNLTHEKKLQVCDRTRLDASRSYYSGDETGIDTVRISPDGGATFYDAGSKQMIDYEWDTAGIKTITVEVVGIVNTTPVTKDYTINVLTINEDCLFSCDAELVEMENEIMKYLVKGRNSFLDKHRAAQHRILSYLDEKGIWDCDGNRLTKEAILDHEEVKDWSRYMVLMMIFEDLRKSPDDFFSDKAESYRNLMTEARNRSVLRLDKDGDGVLEKGEYQDLTSINMSRRGLPINDCNHC